MIRTVFARKSIYWMMIMVAGGSLVLSMLPQMITSLMSSSNSIGSVNGLPISLYEYRAELAKENRIIAAYREQFGPNYRKILSYIGKSENIEQNVQEQIISNKLLLAMAQSIPSYLHSAYITRELAQPRVIYGVLGEGIPAHYLFNDQGILKLDMLHRFLKHQGLTMEQFEKLAEELLTAQWGLKLAYGSVAISKSGQELFNRAKFYSRTFTLETLELAPFIKEESAKPLSNEEITVFYENNSTSSAYWGPERRSGNLWTFDIEKFTPEVEEKDKGKKVDLEEKRQHFMGMAQQLLLLGDDKAFEQFVSNYQGKASSLVKVMVNKEGLNPKGLNTASPNPQISALFSGGKIGEKTASAEGSKGYIVEVTDIIAPHKLSFEDIRDTVADDLYRSRAQAKALQALNNPAQDATKKTTLHNFTLLPQAKATPAALEAVDLSLDILRGLIMPGQHKEGANARYAYRVTLTHSEADAKVRDELGSDAERARKLYEAEGELMLRNLIASLRSHAIILIRTES